MNRPAPALEADRALRNFDAFDLALNLAARDTASRAAE
jgi:hypothetical protein